MLAASTMTRMDTNKEVAVPTVLITGIEPFDGETLNPSWEAARQLDGSIMAIIIASHISRKIKLRV